MMKEQETISTDSSNEDKHEKKKSGGISELYEGKLLSSKLNFDYNKGLFW